MRSTREPVPTIRAAVLRVVLALSILGAGRPLLAEDQTPDTAETPEFNEVRAFVPLAPEDVFNKHAADAVAAFEREDFRIAMAHLDAALEMEPRSAFLHNLAGAVHTKQEDYPEARRSYERALEIEPGFFPAIFNMGELMFLEGNYEEALTFFQNLHRQAPGNELLGFKLVVIHLKLDQPEAARRIARTIRYPGETPAWYYSKGAILLAEGKRRHGMRHLRSAREIYTDQTSLFEETLVEAGML